MLREHFDPKASREAREVSCMMIEIRVSIEII
jgi:hypothetical protein